MNSEARQAAEAFGLKDAGLQVISEGLIHQTFRATAGTTSLLLQQINTQVFTKPELLISNYLHICHHLKSKNMFLPEAVPSLSGNYLYFSNRTVWRATAYLPDTFTVSTHLTPDLAFRAAACFARYLAALSDLNPNLIQPAISDFHNLRNRYLIFEKSCERDSANRKMKILFLIDGLRSRCQYVRFFDSLAGNSGFVLRIMHCDCKISNILFDRNTHQAVCPVDWDTAMPGYFFSDIGDLIRSTVSALPESSPDFTLLEIRKDIYHALTSGYLSHAAGLLTETEKQYLHYAGLLMTYMQALRFTTDYLNGDVYYKTTYPDQNLHRAMNQLTLLEKLEAFITFEMNLPVF
ncbi:MAG: aminoglycoside phosphotransferase family protein [Cyclobacteriaceae bacterium]|nr:aminoglycoside phosphotransferase family protein [Cyclobacteriaceae bacterium]